MNTKEAGYLCLGAAVGAGVAALFAPRSGPETRKYLHSKAAEGTNYAKTRAEVLATSVNDFIDCGTRTAKEHTGNLKAAVDAGKEAYKEAVLTTPDH